MPTDQVAKIRELLEDFDTAMLITQARGQAARARPMAIARVEADCSLWFFTGRDTEKVQEIQSNDHVLIACQNERRRYISLSGSAELVSDRAKAGELWKPSFKAWFPRSVDDPNLLLIVVHPQAAEYWDNQGINSIRYLFEATRAYATGTRPRVKEGQQHGKVAMR
jgi:general stress protein 26